MDRPDSQGADEMTTSSAIRASVAISCVVSLVMTILSLDVYWSVVPEVSDIASLIASSWSLWLEPFLWFFWTTFVSCMGQWILVENSNQEYLRMHPVAGSLKSVLLGLIVSAIFYVGWAVASPSHKRASEYFGFPEGSLVEHLRDNVLSVFLPLFIASVFGVLAMRIWRRIAS